jgi:hypothetical protein
LLAAHEGRAEVLFEVPHTDSHHAIGKHSLHFHSDLRLERLIAHVGSIPMKEKVMKASSKIALAMVGSFALGATAVQSLHAQATPPGYAIVEVNVMDKEGTLKNLFR